VAAQSLDAPLPRQTVPSVRTTAASRSPNPGASAEELNRTPCVRGERVGGSGGPLRLEGTLSWGRAGHTITWQAGPQMVRNSNLLRRQPVDPPRSLIKVIMPDFSERSSRRWRTANTNSFSAGNLKLPFAGFPGLPAHRRICFTESQNVWGWKGPLWVTQSNPPAKAGSPTAGCTEPRPGGS